jgi:hypothetical protein
MMLTVNRRIKEIKIGILRIFVVKNRRFVIFEFKEISLE